MNAEEARQITDNSIKSGERVKRVEKKIGSHAKLGCSGIIVEKLSDEEAQYFKDLGFTVDQSSSLMTKISW
jgi:hypothetical protein